MVESNEKGEPFEALLVSLIDARRQDLEKLRAADPSADPAALEILRGEVQRRAMDDVLKLAAPGGDEKTRRNASIAELCAVFENLMPQSFVSQDEGSTANPQDNLDEARVALQELLSLFKPILT
jgi:hypothetical protein